MKQISMSWQWLAKRLAYLLIATVVFACMLSVIITQAAEESSSAPAWASPASIALRLASPAYTNRDDPILLDNMDCVLLDYRHITSGTTRSGCFSESAFGLVDTDSGTVIFNGTDEGLRLLPFVSQEILVPWPGSTVLLALDSINTGGAIMTLYKNPLPVMQDQRDFVGRVVAKQLTAPAELPVLDPSGQRLVINPQTMAFSDGGSWLVAETVNGSFVRINLASLQVTAFARSYVTQGSPGALASHVAVSEDGHFVAIANDFAAEFKVFDLTTCDGIVNNLKPQACRSYDYRSLVSQNVSGLRYIRHIRFINDGLLSFEARSDNTLLGGIYQLAPTDSIKFFSDYIGIGDSYTSGEGAFNYLAGTDTVDNGCHLSGHSYPLLITKVLFTPSGGHSVACSGAHTNDLANTSDNYRGQVKGITTWRQLREVQQQQLESIMINFLPGYIAQHRFVQRWQPRIVTASVGGNDIGFGNLLKSCVIPRVSLHASANACFNTYEDRLEVFQLIDRTMPGWTALFRQLQREAPASRIYVIGYPQIALDSGYCARNVNLSRSELEFATSLITYLNTDIEKAAQAANLNYVDISQALVGSRLCEAASYAVAMNGLTAGKDGGPLGRKIFGTESYHPNALGQSLIAQAILRGTHNLTSAAAPVSTSPSKTSAVVLSALPKSGRLIYSRIPVNDLTSDTVRGGFSATLQANGIQTGLKSQSVYFIRLDGSTGQTLATTTSDAIGDIATKVSIPVTTPPGGHTIDVTGINQAGQPVNLTQPIYVLASENDADGDTKPDSLDTCPGAADSNRDEDQDGIDDVCDNLISAPPTTITPGTPTIATTFHTPKALGGKTSNPQISAQHFEQQPSGNNPAQTMHNEPLVPALITKSTDWQPWVLIPGAIWGLIIVPVYSYWLVVRHNYAAK